MNEKVQITNKEKNYQYNRFQNFFNRKKTRMITFMPIYSTSLMKYINFLGDTNHQSTQKENHII